MAQYLVGRKWSHEKHAIINHKDQIELMYFCLFHLSWAGSSAIVFQQIRVSSWGNADFINTVLVAFIKSGPEFPSGETTILGKEKFHQFKHLLGAP